MQSSWHVLRVTRVTCLKMQWCRHLRCCASSTCWVMQSCRNLSSVTRVTCHKLRLRGRVSQAKRLQCYTCHVSQAESSPGLEKVPDAGYLRLSVLVSVVTVSRPGHKLERVVTILSGRYAACPTAGSYDPRPSQYQQGSGTLSTVTTKDIQVIRT